MIYPIQKETIESDTFLSTAKSSPSNTCSQLFMGNISGRCILYPLGKESQNETALQDYYRQVGFTPVLKTDNAKIEL